MNEIIKISKFTSINNPMLSFDIPFIQTSKVDLVEGTKLVLTQESKEVLEKDYQILSNSYLKKDGATVIFGTFDNLHAGHLNMLRTAKSFGNELYVGIESLEKASIRKAGKHKIQSAFERMKNMEKAGITNPRNIFIRSDALEDIKRLINEGVKITTLAVGESQNDNPEMCNAVDWCLKNGIQVVAIKRLKTKDDKREISSSAIRKEESRGI